MPMEVSFVFVIVKCLKPFHKRELTVQCRSLESLLADGVISSKIGILKTDTEGNDLRVLQGLGELRPQVVICEFFTDGLYQGWKDGHPLTLIEYLQKLGYADYMAFSRAGDLKKIKINPTDFEKKEWGNLLFFHKSIAEKLCVKEEIDTGLNTFLIRQLSAQDQCGSVLDVGAFHGDFSMELLTCDRVSNAVLFEANPEVSTYLLDRLKGDDRCTVVQQAVSSQCGQVDFNVNDDPATGSVLNYSSSESPVRTMSVEQITLDKWLKLHTLREPVCILKIDTQGHDLDVLKGAENLILDQSPLIVLELIWVELYDNQVHPSDIFSWMNERGYKLAASFNEHYCVEGYLAFSDAVFIPKKDCESITPEFHMHPDTSHLQTEVSMLRKVCEERLELIERLNHQLTVAGESSKMLHKVCEERLELLERLHKQLNVDGAAQKTLKTKVSLRRNK
jgi:FkbM family methyltransferase